jgi:hypothetical protein
MTFSLDDKLKVIERELALRKQVYPGSVKTGRMKQAEADFQIGVMEAIAIDIRRAIERRGPS